MVASLLSVSLCAKVMFWSSIEIQEGIKKVLSISPSYMFMHQHLVMMTVRSITSTRNCRKPYTKRQKGHSGCKKGIGMLKLGRMHRQTEEKFVDFTAMSRQMREVSDS